MKKLKIKIAAFTILEMVMAMLLISVVVAMTYAVFFMVSSYGTKMNKSNLTQNNYLLAAAVFRNDIQKAALMKIGKDSSLICLSEQQNISYQILGQHLIRTLNDLSDTLLTHEDMRLTVINEGNQNHPEFLKSALITITDSLGKKSYLSGNKIYSSTSLFNPSPDAGN